MKKLSLFFIFILSFSIVYAAKIKPQDVKSAINSAVENFNTGNCADAFPVFNELLSGNYPLIKDNPNLEYSLLAYAGYCARELSDTGKALLYFSKAIKLAKAQEILDQLPVFYSFIGEIYRENNDYKKANLYYSSAILAFGEVNSHNILEVATLWYLLSNSYRDSGDLKDALESCSKASEYAAEAGNITLQIACAENSGGIYLGMQDYPNAIRKFNYGLTMARNSQMPVEMGSSHMGLALVYESIDKPELAKQNYDEALRLYCVSSAFDNIEFIIEKVKELISSADKQQKIKSADSYMLYAASIAEAENVLAYKLYMLAADYYFSAQSQSIENALKAAFDISSESGNCSELSEASSKLLLHYSNIDAYEAFFAVYNETRTTLENIKDKSCIKLYEKSIEGIKAPVKAEDNVSITSDKGIYNTSGL